MSKNDLVANMTRAMGGSGKNKPQLPKGEGRGRIDDTHQVAVLTDLEAHALNTLRWEDKDAGFSSGSGPKIKALAAQNTRPFDFVEYRGEKIPTLNDSGSYGGGDSGSGSTGGNGGAGATSSITGSPTARAGGGGGASSNSTDGSGGSGGGGSGTSPGGTGGAGSANTGGGGGAGGSPTNATGGAGGSGIVVIRYKFQ